MGRGAQRFAFACASTSQEPSRSSSEHSPPPRALYGLLRLYYPIGVGPPPTLLLLGRLRRFTRLSAGEQLLFEPQPAAATACFVELNLEDGFPWYKDDSVLDRKDDAVEAYGFQHAAGPGGSELTVPAATAKHIH